MKKHLRVLLAFSLCLHLAPLCAQPGPRPGGMGGMGGPPPGPGLSGRMSKLFGDNSAFSATLEIQAKDSAASEATILPGKIAFAEGKSRFEMDMTRMKGGNIPPESAAQMKAMGMDNVVTISRPDKKLRYQVFPGKQAYIESAIEESDATTPPEKFKIETAELGKETVEGHPCVKSKAVVTDDNGKKTEYTVWNATDLKNFPLKIETTEQGGTTTMLFKDVKLARPDAALFNPPPDFKSHASFMGMIQQEMMKRMGGDMDAPPGPP